MHRALLIDKNYMALSIIPWKKAVRLLVKGKAELYRSAINGIPNEHGWSMPPRGGVDRLSDVQVRLAVDYMLAVQARIDAQRQP